MREYKKGECRATAEVCALLRAILVSNVLCFQVFTYVMMTMTLDSRRLCLMHSQTMIIMYQKLP